MQSGRSYLLVVDLAVLEYDKYSRAAQSQSASWDFNKWLATQEHDRAVVKILANTDELFFERLESNQQAQQLEIDIAKMRQIDQEGFRLKGSPFEYLAAHQGNAPFSFGKAVWRIKTKAGVTGAGLIKFSIWADDKPVDEFSYNTCIGVVSPDQCPAPTPSQNSLRGVDLTNRSSTPDAAIHFVEFGSQNLLGVFRCNTCGWGESEFKTWKVGHGASWLRQQFELTVLPGIKLAANGPDSDSDPSFNEQTFVNAGDALLGLIFHTQDGNVSEAESAFHTFVSQAASIAPASSSVPSLFVRLLPENPDEAFFIPIGLARARTGPSRRDFIGFHFRIETPLELQSYSPSAQCIRKWILLVPPPSITGNALVEARAGFSDWITRFQHSTNDASLFSDLNEFKNWVDPDSPSTVDSSVILIMSHHENNRFYFDQDLAAVFATNIKRRFTAPSVAILNACGTANPGAFEFVREFNLHGVNAVVASTVDINGRMGGVFLRFLADTLDSHSADSAYTLDRAVFDAIMKLKAEPDTAEGTQMYGARALLFELIGNGSLRVCTPVRN
jgi:hypothetical protein